MIQNKNNEQETVRESGYKVQQLNEPWNYTLTLLVAGTGGLKTPNSTEAYIVSITIITIVIYCFTDLLLLSMALLS